MAISLSGMDAGMTARLLLAPLMAIFGAALRLCAPPNLAAAMRLSRAG
jgi:hypothetical protein